MKSEDRLSFGVREAKAQFSQLLQEVRQGREVLITDRGRPIGKLVPIQPGDLTLQDRLAGLVAPGVLEAPDARPRRPLPPPVAGVGEAAQRILQEDRNS